MTPRGNILSGLAASSDGRLQHPLDSFAALSNADRASAAGSRAEGAEAAMFADVAAQQLDGASDSPAAAAPVIASGKGNVIAVVGDRLPPYPDVPTMTEQGAVGGSYETQASPPSPSRPQPGRTSPRSSADRGRHRR